MLRAPETAPAPRAPELVEAEALLADAEAAVERNELDDALAFLADVRPLVRARPELELRSLVIEASGRMAAGDVTEAITLLERARRLADARPFTDTDRASVFFRLGCCSFKLSDLEGAVEQLTVALELCDHSGLPCDRLRSEILQWRTRCYRRLRSWGAAHRDAERAVELAEAIGDERVRAGAYFQASIVAERAGQLLMARFYAEAARELYAHAGDEAGVGRVLNNLGGICHLLGRDDEARAHLHESFRIALDRNTPAEAAYAVSSSGQVALRNGDAELAEQNARYALELLDARSDHVNELGNAQLVLGRALLAQGRLDDADEALAAADSSYARMQSPGHHSTVLLARGDVAARRGDSDAAARHYRAAAELLQDVRF